MEKITSQLVSIYHVEQYAGLEEALTAAKSQSGADLKVLMPNVVRHLERSGYPNVVGKAIEVLREMVKEESLREEFNRWQGINRLVAALDHKHEDVRVLGLVFLAQLARDSRHHDTIALAKGYRELVAFLEVTEERVRLASAAVLRVLMSTPSNVSDFARAGGFQALFRLIRQRELSAKFLSQCLVLLRLSASNRSVAIEIKSAGFESDVSAHLSVADEDVQTRTLEALEAIVDDEAGRAFSKANGKLLATLTAYVAMTTNSTLNATAQSIIKKLN